MKSQIVSIGTALPQHSFSQEEVASFMIRYLDMGNQEANWLKKVYNNSGIENRYSVLSDFGDDYEPKLLFDEKNPSPTTADRLAKFRKEAVHLGEAASQESLEEVGYEPETITHLITVSCTGMYAPGLDIDLIKTLDLPADTARVSINFMGCYAVFNALNTANHITQSEPNAKVLVVAVELCSLHFQANHQKEHIIANALFGDGAGAAIIENEENGEKKGISLKDFKSNLIPNTGDEMTWHIGDNGFEMFLSKSIPEHIGQPVHNTVNTLLARNQITYKDLGYLAAHPGGVRILDAIENTLPLPEPLTGAGRDVLRTYGNMSSPTILFVLQKLYQEANQNISNPFILGMAFGPGLTIQTGLFAFNH